MGGAPACWGGLTLALWGAARTVRPPDGATGTLRHNGPSDAGRSAVGARGPFS
jgi:hypothetical protein